MFQAEESDYEDWTEAMSVLINKIERKNGLNEQQNDVNMNNNEGRIYKIIRIKWGSESKACGSQ